MSNSKISGIFLIGIIFLVGFFWIAISAPNIVSSNKEAVDLDLYIKDHRFHPEIIRAPAGVKIRLTVHNQDRTIEEFESIDLKREKIIPGKSKVRMIFAPLKVGEYKFYGEFYEDTAQGKIIVEKKITDD